MHLKIHSPSDDINKSAPAYERFAMLMKAGPDNIIWTRSRAAQLVVALDAANQSKRVQFTYRELDEISKRILPVYKVMYGEPSNEWVMERFWFYLNNPCLVFYGGGSSEWTANELAAQYIRKVKKISLPDRDPSLLMLTVDSFNMVSKRVQDNAQLDAENKDVVYYPSVGMKNIWVEKKELDEAIPGFIDRLDAANSLGIKDAAYIDFVFGKIENKIDTTELLLPSW